MAAKPLRCFIAAPFGADTRRLREKLSERKVVWTDVTNAPLGASVSDAVGSAIESADFVCVVITDAVSSPLTWLEAGMALGAHKPLLLIADRKAKIPSDLMGLQVALAGMDEVEALDFQLEQFLDTLAVRRRRTSTSGKAPSRRESKRAPVQRRSSEAESEIAQLFESAGYLLYEVPAKQGTYQVDLAVWIDDLLPVFSSPILPVEVIGRWDAATSVEVTSKLRSFLLETGAGVGLVVHPTDGPSSGESRTLSPGPPPFVFALSREDLRVALVQHRLVRQLVDMRNRAVHGV